MIHLSLDTAGGFQTNILFVFIIPTRATCPARLIYINVFTLIIFSGVTGMDLHRTVFFSLLLPRICSSVLRHFWPMFLCVHQVERPTFTLMQINK
jgi:hypothetical protein